jgi:DNA primase
MEISDLLESVDILDYIAQYTEFTEKNGEFWALSPLKEENTPSFSVRRETNSFYDFSSGVGGNVITFIRYYHKCSASAAVEMLKAYAGISDETFTPRKRLAALDVARRYQRKTKNTKDSKTTRLPDDYMDRYEVRPDKLAVWLDEGISAESLEKFQVRYDSFSDRLVYPIRDPAGNIINVSGRTVDPEWKEKKLRKYTYFKPLGILDTIYGFAENRRAIEKSGEIILFEGAKSVMLADSWGISNTGAVLTSHLNPYQMKLLIRLGCRVVFALDKDVSIKDDHNIKKLKQYVRVEYVCDTDDLLTEKMSPVDAGYETWKKLYEGRCLWK